MQIDTRKLKKLIIKAVPYVAFSYVGNLIGFAYRTAEGDGFQKKILPFMSNLGVAFARIFPSLHPFDLLFGLVLAGVMRLVLYVKSKNKKKFRQGEEYGSAVWGGEKDIEPYMDLSCPENNVILTRTESLTMGKPSAPKFARNKNILVIGGSGSGKTRFFVKPNLMQMHSSYVVTDPKGTVLVECGKMLERGRPKRVDGKVVYEEGKEVLKGLDLDIFRGHKIAIVGATGSGKTTIVNLLTRFYEPDSGTITVDGTDIRDIRKDELRRSIAIVLQDTVLFSGTIEENIRYGREDADEDSVKRAARHANADEFIRHLPEGYDTRLTEGGANLSQGQRQLLTIARAVLADPKILILDEATSSVDTRTEMHIQSAMVALMKNRTSLIIAHRLSTIRDADVIAVINGGRVTELGRHEELIEKRGCYYELYRTQFAGNKT